MSKDKQPRLFSNTPHDRSADAWVLPTTPESPSQKIYIADAPVKDLIKVDHFRGDENGGYSVTPMTRQTYIRLDALPESLRAEVFTYFERQLLAVEEEAARKELTQVLKVIPSGIIDVPPEIDFGWDLPKSAPID